MSEIEVKDDSMKAQEIIGKKLLSLTPAQYSSPDFGDMVLIVEAKDVSRYDGVDLIQMQWRIVLPTPEIFRLFYERGIYKLVGVGIVVGKENYGRYQVMVQDNVAMEFDDTIPF